MSITCNGVVAPHDSFIVMQPTGESGPGGLLKFMFSAPSAGGGELIFNIVPGSNPQGPGAYSVAVAGGTERLAIVDAGIFKNNVLAVFGHSSAPVPFAVTIG